MKQTNNYEQKYEVTPLELSFDLIYAFALSQVTEFMMADLTWLTIIKALIILGAVYMVWSYTSWAATMIPAEQAKGRRMLLVIMLLGFFMNISIEDAFAENACFFAGIYLVIQFGRTIWTLINSPNREFKEHFKRVLIWLFVTAPLWFIGIFCTGILQIELWGIAIIIDLIGTWTAHPVPYRRILSQDLFFDDGHLLERCRLFRIIAFGEMVYSAGDALREAHFTFVTVILGCISMAEIISLWTLTFGRFVKIIAQHRENNKNPLLVSRYAINVLVIILFGIVFMSVGNKYIILHPYERVPTILVFIFGSGPLMFLLAQGWYLYKIPKVRSTLYIISGIILGISNVVGLFQQAWIYHIVLGGILITVSYIDFLKIEKN